MEEAVGRKASNSCSLLLDERLQKVPTRSTGEALVASQLLHFSRNSNGMFSDVLGSYPLLTHGPGLLTGLYELKVSQLTSTDDFVFLKRPPSLLGETVHCPGKDVAAEAKPVFFRHLLVCFQGDVARRPVRIPRK